MFNGTSAKGLVSRDYEEFAFLKDWVGLHKGVKSPGIHSARSLQI